MIINQNEKYLLKFISGTNTDTSKSSDLLEVIFKLGIKLNFKNHNSVYQIIDEMSYPNHCKSLIGK